MKNVPQPKPAPDHPRGCGENRCQRQPIIEYIGSPPRMRGKQGACSNQRRYQRITPADAGKTVTYLHDVESAKDHPRGCGENPKSSYVGLLAKGSPPRMRGKLFSFSFLRITIRITPADAGKTHAVAAGSACAGDHPRGCGENPTKNKRCLILSGSPPRMRGKRRQYQSPRGCKRITPADAGKT